MNHQHKDQDLLKQELESAKRKITIGAKYRHFKSPDNVYTVMDLGFLEATDKLCVIYKADYGGKFIFVRPLDVWLEQVDWQGKKVQRFSKI
jgi:hypothetical protein